MSLFGTIFNSTNLELPRFNTLDAGIDYVVPYVAMFGERISEQSLYLDKRWMEVRDDVNFQETVLHIFKEGGVYMRILDGDISTGNWELNIGGFILKFAGKNELFELVFLNEDYFILRKHGDQSTKGQRKYFFIVRESLARRKEWTDLLTILFQIYKGNTNYIAVVALFLVVVAVVLFFSLL
jgi:hypothetical protein